MKLILGFLPFLAFALISAAGYSKLALLAGAVIAGVGIVRDATSPGKKPKTLEVGTFVLFSALAIAAWLAGMDLSVALVRICVDAGLLVIVFATIVVGKPFTLEYAKERISPSQWTNASFIETNKVVSGAWGVAFAVAVAAVWRSGAVRFRSIPSQSSSGVPCTPPTVSRTGIRDISASKL